jgi:hypothetical protein
MLSPSETTVPANSVTEYTYSFTIEKKGNLPTLKKKKPCDFHSQQSKASELLSLESGETTGGYAVIIDSPELLSSTYFHFIILTTFCSIKL